MSRISKGAYYLYIARTVSLRSTCLNKHYGAVIVKDDRIIATGYNGSPRGEANCCDIGCCYCQTHNLLKSVIAAKHGTQYGACVAVHAEKNAILQASGQDLKGATLYLEGVVNKLRAKSQYNESEQQQQKKQHFLRNA